MDDGVEIDDVEVKVETDKALLVDIDGDEYWLPKSQILEDSEVQGKDDVGTLLVTRWWAEKEGLD